MTDSYFATKEDKLVLRKRLIGEDGHKVFSIRIKTSTYNNLNQLSEQTNRSRNELINTLLEYAIMNCVIK